jgi:hypothetical protein
MQIEFDKTKMLRYIEAWNSRDLDRYDQLVDEICSDDLIQHDPNMPGFPPGIAAQKAFAREVIANNPDLHFSLDELVLTGDRLIVRGEIQTNHPTSGAVERSVFIEMDRIVGGKIAETWTVSMPGKW